ncbi:MAG: Rid family detoxifying hydrolase [Bacteroidota bacterium]|nr:Rid family detoxifying hydrolase [Candidatus Kapabacteria bacterium]MCS7303210.1 Rid family detoxifying hydrolase [Candidatus Kapabacteria bacterium]MCX7936730.1 Rid family detoxifying hydrolase [Chlorobiota bacterium]MDW8074226.1 Rid family detoxifying hydrolase [Bacteroidota bacterium]MDW8271298.1 Rid family detoxifying hydrolase [Bacteroidota bacterium]
MKETITPSVAPAPIGPYSPIVHAHGALYFISGQIALDEDGNLVGSTTAEQTEQICRNIGVLLNAIGLDFEHVVKTTVYLRSMDDFSAMNAIYAKYFGASKPARTTVEVSRLPKDALVEIDVIAVR